MIDKKIETSDLDVNYIIDIVQSILDKNHTDPKKKEIRAKLDGNRKELNFNCPVCGDGHSSKFRGHLFLSNFYYVCYNERETDSMSFTNFCKHFNVQLDPEKKLQIYNHIDKNFTYSKKDDFAIGNLDKLIPIDDFFNHMNDSNSFLSNVRPIVEGSIFHNYLIDRKITNFENIYQGVYRISSTWKEPVLIILNRAGDKLLGFQLRNLKEKKEQRIYKFYQFSDIYNLMYPDDNLDPIESISYNKISAVFNILNVDFEREVYVFEGYLDSVFFPNSIALVGLDTDISFLNDENLNLRFVLDNDIAGLKKSKSLLDDGHSIFLWKKLFKNLSKNKPKIEHYLSSNIKDINKLAQEYDTYDVYNTYNLSKYFAKDKFDLIDM